MKSVKETYDALLPSYESASSKLRNLVNALLEAKKIKVHAVESRVKSSESFCQKAGSYDNPFSDITDYIGLRIICYIPSDIEKVCSLIEREFDIDEKNSVNKTKSLGTDKVGYESVHYVCCLNSARKALSEFSFMRDFCFEIQIRTILQHTWAEIEHDKNYKFNGTLPDSLKRRFNIISGTLELIDREFDSLVSEIDAYKLQIKKEVAAQKFDVELTSDSLRAYFETKGNQTLLSQNSLAVWSKKSDEVIQEMHDFGLETLNDFIELDKKYGGDDFLADGQSKTIAGYVRDCMMLDDCKKYFDRAWNGHWTGLTERMREFLEARHIDFQELVKGLS